MRGRKKIGKSHQNDGAVQFRQAEIKEYGRQSESAAQLINEAVQCGYHQPEPYLKHSRFRGDNGELIGVVAVEVEDAWRVLETKDISPTMVRKADWILTHPEKRKPERL